MKLRRLLLSGLLAATGILNAQTDFRPGYIINAAGDTLYGQIDYRGDLLMSSVCRFKDIENQIKEYAPNDIIAYRFKDSKYYVSRELKSRNYFLEFLIKGKVSIYYMRDDLGDHYYLDKEGLQLVEIPYEEGIKYVDDRRVSYKSKNHIGILNYYMQDASAFQSRIEKLGKPDHESLINLAEDYHNNVCKDGACVIYEKKIPFITILPEIAAGTINFSGVEDLNDKFYSHVGIIGHIWMPRTNEKMYFRTGILFSQLDFEDGKRNFYKMPFQLEYIYPKGIFRPRIAYGLNYYIPSYLTVSFNLGSNIKLNKKLFLSLTSDIEFNSTVIIIPNDIFSYSLQLGLFMSLYQCTND